MVKAVIGWFDSAWMDAGTRLRSIGAASHGCGDNASDLLRRLDKMPVGKMCAARRGSVPSMTEQLADQGQIFAGHDGLTGCGMTKVMEAQAAKLRVVAYRPPTRCEAIRAPTLGVSRKRVRGGVEGGTRFFPIGDVVETFEAFG